MDTFSHGLIGAIILSRSGLLGGQSGVPPDDKGQARVCDWTLGAALLFGVFPDLASLGGYLVYHVLRYGVMGWAAIPPWVFTLYNFTHSLIIAGIFIGLVALRYRLLALTMLAWPLHILTDMFTHGAGRFATPIFFPFSDYRFYGVNWWENGWLSYAPLAVCILAFPGMLFFRNAQRRRSKAVS